RAPPPDHLDGPTGDRHRGLRRLLGGGRTGALATGEPDRLGRHAAARLRVPGGRLWRSVASRWMATVEPGRPHRVPLRRSAEEHRARRAAGGGAVSARGGRTAAATGARLSPSATGDLGADR